ncbi:MAG: GNAT family N-acetyltransferase [Thermoplasmata archaeon]
MVRRLFQDYRQWLADHQDPATQSGPRVREGIALVDQLIAELPGAYGPPHGEILLWFEDDRVVACGAIRELEPNVGEIKRIYVRPDYRGKGFGHPFVRALIDQARRLGYERLRVDTLPTMQAAIEFYQELGFRPIKAFWSHPVANALFFEREISD